MNAERGVAMVHFHLRPGGVTTVIERAAAALDRADVPWVVLCGDAAGTRLRSVRVVPELGYDGQGRPGELARAMRESARAALGGDPALYHFHNHAIGKNTVLPAAVHELAAAGARLLLQIHDFVEDGRPGNFLALKRAWGGRLGEILYPDAPNVHYAALNLRDHALLRSAGLDPARAHLLPNCVDEDAPAHPPNADAAPFFIYPTRAIRRKNLGEFLLWSLLSEPGARWAATLAPRSAADVGPYEQWKTFAAEMRLPVEFEIGLRQGWTLSDLLREATAIVTTSVAEGFGLAFLEPWLAGRPLYGRNLPDITMDLGESGLELNHLYPSLQVPTEWVGGTVWQQAVAEGLRRVYEAYGRAPPDLSLVPIGRHVDFGQLDEALQRKVLLRLARDPSAREEICPPGLDRPSVGPEQMFRNASVVRNRYGTRAYADRLRKLYGTVAASECSSPGSLQQDRLLDGFLDPTRFNLLRS